MLFNSYIFIFLFFPLVLAGYHGLNHAGKHQAARFFLIGMSLLLCGYGSIFGLVVLFVSIVLNYGVILFILYARDDRRKKAGLSAGLALNIGLLFFFKYYNFFTENINMAFCAASFAFSGNAGASAPGLSLLRLSLPLGISFYTFQQLSCIIDTYRGECRSGRFLDYLLYVTFFPKLIQGPIVPHGELIPQFHSEKSRRISFESLSRGLYSFALGLSKKVLLADTFSGIVAVGYANIGELNAISVLLVMVCYSLQIYFDFSGYCDMACGAAGMLGIRLPFNFDSPYKAQSVSDFWDRWHTTLTRFFTKYLYIPLGGSRRGLPRTCLNTMIVFLVSGLWHGANWTFILWGAMHGLVMVTEKITHVSSLKIPRFVRVAVTFLFVTFAWSLFRANSVKEAGMLWAQLFRGGAGPIYQPLTEAFEELIEVKILFILSSRLGPASLSADYSRILLPAFTCVCLLGCFTMKNTQEKTEQMRFSGKTLFVVVALMFWSIMSLSEMSEFLYSNF